MQDVLEEVGLKSMAHYIEVKYQSIAVYVMDWPIFGMY